MTRAPFPGGPAGPAPLVPATEAPRQGQPARDWGSWLLSAIIAGAVLAPPIALGAGVPDVRVEQVLAVAALAWLTSLPSPPLKGRGTRTRDQTRTALPLPFREGGRAVRSIDLAFLALATATLTSILYAGLVLGERVSPRDGYEVVKLGLYWVLFRFALTAGSEPRARWGAPGALLAAGALSAVFGLAQYFDWPGVRGIGGWWAPAHHMRALARDGRAFGTAANPNYFGALMAMLAVTALVVTTWAVPASGRRRGLVTTALALAALGVVLSGSRGALAMLMVAVTAVWALTAVTRTRRRALVMATALLCAAFAGSVLLVEIRPRGRDDYLTRVAGALSPTGDGDLALRIERWRGIAGGSRRHGAEGVPGPPVSGTGHPAASAEARGRDQRRKADVDALVAAITRYQETAGVLPAGPLLDALVPGSIERLPADPADGAPYRYERTATGFTVAVRIEDPADPDYPLFAAGFVRNYVLNGDVEEADGARAVDFRALAGTNWGRAPEAALFGAGGIIFRGNPVEPGRRAAVYQQRYVNRSGGAPFTASVWVKLPVPVRGEVFLYTNVYYTDGERQDPYARIAADSFLTGVWQRLAVTITPEAGRRVDFIGVYLLADQFEGEAYADGFELVDGSVPVSFTGLREASDATLGLDAGAQFHRSPVFGVGPRKAEDAGTVDNEYLLVLARYGVVGLAAYLALWGTVLAAVVRRFRRGAALAGAAAGVVAGLLVFNLVAGSLYQLQLMGVFWPLVGLALATARAPAVNRQ